jgi:hypothetical protein
MDGGIKKDDATIKRDPSLNFRDFKSDSDTSTLS